MGYRPSFKYWWVSDLGQWWGVPHPPPNPPSVRKGELLPPPLPPRLLTGGATRERGEGFLARRRAAARPGPFGAGRPRPWAGASAGLGGRGPGGPPGLWARGPPPARLPRRALWRVGALRYAARSGRLGPAGPLCRRRRCRLAGRWWPAGCQPSGGCRRSPVGGGAPPVARGRLPPCRPRCGGVPRRAAGARCVAPAPCRPGRSARVCGLPLVALARLRPSRSAAALLPAGPPWRPAPPGRSEKSKVGPAPRGRGVRRRRCGALWRALPSLLPRRGPGRPGLGAGGGLGAARAPARRG